MYISEESLKQFTPAFPLEQFAPLEEILFLDIETTGFSPASTQLYLIGLIYYCDGKWVLRQLMAESAAEEKELLLRLSQLTARFSTLVHFNGIRFDINYLMQKAAQYDIDLPLDSLLSIDLYRQISPWRDRLGLTDCRQRTIEEFMGLHRKDPYTGGELIQYYKAYTVNPDDSVRSLLMQHNRDDMKGLLYILPMLAYGDILRHMPVIRKAAMTKTKNHKGELTCELTMELKLQTPVPRPLTLQYDGITLLADGAKLMLLVPVLDTELKYYYPNYKNYYYIPALDAAYHKSVASFAEKEYRVQATAATCYTRRRGYFLKQYSPIVEPYYKADYKDNVTYFEITMDTRENKELFQCYAEHLIKTILKKDKQAPAADDRS
ncbi:MAG: ribonuclease H-like domain-containing protein [Lachnospiraceae bacterium]|nr:ribonuclease H-like domain-containing protein [Lachnospiraceae bacterium]